MVILSAFAVDFGLAYSFARSKQRSQMNAYLFWAAVGLIPLLSVLSLGLLASVS